MAAGVLVDDHGAVEDGLRGDSVGLCDNQYDFRSWGAWVCEPLREKKIDL